jgi:hypothetical protein
VHFAAGLAGEISQCARKNGLGDLAAAAVESFVESGGRVIEGSRIAAAVSGIEADFTAVQGASGAGMGNQKDGGQQDRGE